MSRRARKEPIAVRIPVRDPDRLAALLEARLGEGDPVRVEVPATLLQDVVAYLHNPHPPLPIPAEILNGWDRVDSACNAIVCALPAQMTRAAENLEREQRAFRNAIFAACRPVTQSVDKT